LNTYCLVLLVHFERIIVYFVGTTFIKTVYNSQHLGLGMVCISLVKLSYGQQQSIISKVSKSHREITIKMASAYINIKPYD